MLGALEVELVGTDDAVGTLLALIGPLLIAGAAVIAAFVARKTANERQAEQLAHDTERQKEQLAHDTERQERQLAHDREIRDREHLFRTVSAAFEHLEDAERYVVATAGWIGSLENTRKKFTDLHEGDELRRAFLTTQLEKYEGEVLKAMDQAHPATMDLWADTALLRLMLGEKDEVVSSHAELVEKTRAWYDAVKEGYYGGTGDAMSLAHSKQVRSEAKYARRQFETSCRRTFGWHSEEI